MLKFKSNDTVKIVSPWSGLGGSTIALIELCNLFNKNGFNAEFYGPQDWHLNQCNGRRIKNLELKSNDYIINHWLDVKNFTQVKNFPSSLADFMNQKIRCRTSILNIHERHGHYLQKDRLKCYDKIVFVSESQKNWHWYYKGPQKLLVIPNVKPKLNKVEIKDKDKLIAGVVGSIEPRKQTHISIWRAMQDGMNKVLLYGKILNTEYFNATVKPLLGQIIFYMGELHPSQKQNIYNSISRVYHSSTDESACLVQGECEIVGIPFYGNENTITYQMLEDKEVFNLWASVLK